MVELLNLDNFDRRINLVYEASFSFELHDEVILISKLYRFNEKGESKISIGASLAFRQCKINSKVQGSSAYSHPLFEIDHYCL